MTVEPPPGAGPLLVADCGIVRIRQKVRADALDDFQWRRDPEMARFDGTIPIEATFTQFLQRFEHDLTFNGHDRHLFAIDTAAGEHIGNLMWYNPSRDRQEVEFGIGIGRPEFRGKGIGTAATVGFLRYLWQATTFRGVYLHTLAWNVRAQQCFARAGFAPAARVFRGSEEFVRMEVRREWWLLWEQEGRFPPPAPRG